MPPGAARAWRRRCALRVPAGACAVRSRAESRARADGGVLRGRIAETFLPDGARRGIPRRAARAAVEPAPHLLVAPFPPSGAGSGNRTHMVSPPRDFESRASTNSAIPALSEKLYWLGAPLRLRLSPPARADRAASRAAAHREPAAASRRQDGPARGSRISRHRPAPPAG